MKKTETRTLVLEIAIKGVSGQTRDANTIKAEGISLKTSDLLIEVEQGKLGELGKAICNKLQVQFPNLEKVFVIVNKEITPFSFEGRTIC